MKPCNFRKLMLAAALSSTNALASTTGNIGTMYGLTPNDIASTQANSMFHHSAASAYYNPAYLADGEHGNFSLNYIYADPELTVTGANGTRNDQSLSNRTAIIGIKFNMNNLLKTDNNMGFALIMGLDNRAKNLMSINDFVSREGQFSDYGEKAMFLSTGIGTEIIDGLNLGLGVLVSIRNNADVTFNVVGLGGTTDQEKIHVGSESDFAHINSLSFDFGKLFCKQSCWADGFKLAYHYREESAFSINLDSKVLGAVLPSSPGVPLHPLIITAMDSYQPEIVKFGAKYTWDNGIALAFSFEEQKWSELTRRLLFANGGNTVKDQGNIQFKDTNIPRVAVIFNDIGPQKGLWQYADISLTFGYTKEESKLKGGLTPEVNLLDNDRDIYGMGIDFTWSKTHLFSYPISLSFAMQYHDLKSREFTLSRYTSAFLAPTVITEGETVTTGGSVLLGTASLTMRF